MTHDLCRIDFEPVGARVDVTVGTSLFEAAGRAGIGISSSCGGEGTCGRCRVIVMEGAVSAPQSSERQLLDALEHAPGQRLACRAHARSDVKVTIPPASLVTLQRLQVAGLANPVAMEPAVRAHAVTASPPSLHDLRSDLDRVAASIDASGGPRRVEAPLEVIAELSPLARRTDWRLTVFLRGHRVAGVAEPGAKPVGFAADLGTTKIAGYLVDLETGEELAATGVANPQIGYGEDVISRLTFAARRPDGGPELARVVRAALDELAGTLAAEAGVARGQIVDACVVGNTAMHHLFLGLPTHQLAVAPFVAAASAPMDVPARDLGMRLSSGASVHLPPCVGGFVGADHVAMVMASGLDRADGVVVGLDIGTNTEIALWRPDADRLWSASCASGPAFEGAHIRHGMRAAAGAIDSVRLTDDGVELTTIAGVPPVGICGSGIVDAVAELHRTGRIDDRGRFQREATGVRPGTAGPEFVLAAAPVSGTGSDITVSQEDVNEIQLAKGAIAAGVDVLLEMTGTPAVSVDELVVAGAFGTYLNPGSALAIGLLPRLPQARLRQVGNAAGAGAKAALVSTRERARARRIADRTTYLELTTFPGFQRRFARSMLFPASAPAGR